MSAREEIRRKEGKETKGGKGVEMGGKTRKKQKGEREKKERRK